MLDGVRWVLFDAVGTLIYPHPPVADVYFAVAREFGSRLSHGEIRERFFTALEDSYADGCETDEAHERQRWRLIVGRVIDDVPEADTVFEQLWQHFSRPQHWQLYDDVAPVLSELRRRGFKIGIASNFDERLKQIVAGHSPLSECDAVFVSTEVGYSKPDCRFFQPIERRICLPAAEIALVGDDEVNDVQAATAAGWRAIRLDRDAKKNAAIHSLLSLIT